MSIKKQMILALYEQAINNLIIKKNLLGEALAHDMISYAEYEERKFLISCQIEDLRLACADLTACE